MILERKDYKWETAKWITVVWTDAEWTITGCPTKIIPDAEMVVLSIQKTVMQEQIFQI